MKNKIQTSTLKADKIIWKTVDDLIIFADYVIKTVRKYGFRPILEGRDYLYFDDEDFAGDVYGEKLRRELGDRLRPIKDNDYDIVKLSCATVGVSVDECKF